MEMFFRKGLTTTSFKVDGTTLCQRERLIFFWTPSVSPAQPDIVSHDEQRTRMHVVGLMLWSILSVSSGFTNWKSSIGIYKMEQLQHSCMWTCMQSCVCPFRQISYSSCICPTSVELMQKIFLKDWDQNVLFAFTFLLGFLRTEMAKLDCAEDSINHHASLFSEPAGN